jgi:hypothetical protein
MQPSRPRQLSSLKPRWPAKLAAREFPDSPGPCGTGVGHQQARADPTLDVVSRAPSLHVEASRFHDREGRLDHVRARQGAAQLGRHPQTRLAGSPDLRRPGVVPRLPTPNSNQIARPAALPSQARGRNRSSLLRFSGRNGSCGRLMACFRSRPEVRPFCQPQSGAPQIPAFAYLCQY